MYILLPSLQSQHLLSWVCYHSALVVGHSQEGTWGMRKCLHSRKGRGVGGGIVQSCVLYPVRTIKHQSSGYSFTITVKQEAKRGCQLPGIPFSPNRTESRESEVDAKQTGTIKELEPHIQIYYKMKCAHWTQTRKLWPCWPRVSGRHEHS